ncbi:MAG: high affinity FE2+/Pb2+ permease [Ramlibacter sp.]|jgi:high-affinity iron transporter|nr:high affinity FE2+/Pb2+ permease [Ramlibacter sp.]
MNLAALLRPFLFLILCCTMGASLVRAAPHDEKAQTIIHMLDYVSVDYPEFVKDGKVLDEPEYQEQREFAKQSVVLLEQLPDNVDKPSLIAKAKQLVARVDDKAPGEEISALARGLAAAVVRSYGVAVAPKQAPDLAKAATLFQAQCAACHGAQGRGDGPLSKGMEPAPSNFHDEARMKQRSIFGLYNTITLGVGGTPMRGFGELSEVDRWALAFLAGNMRATPDQVGKGEALWKQGTGKQELGSYRALVTQQPGELKSADLDAVRSYLTAQPSAIAAAAPAPLDVTRGKLAESLASYRAGDRAGARQHAITAYLEGFELVEAGLDNVDAPLRRQVEDAMMALRSDIDGAKPVEAVAQRVDEIGGLLARVDEKLGAGEMSAAAAFTSSLLILLREGLEAILVLAAIVAFVRKTGRNDALPYIHVGWIAAVALGVATWFAANYLLTISGANREITEGVSALVAAAMLLYVGLWLHRRSTAQAWQGFIRDQVTTALGKRTLWAMAGISFLAVYRELFEVILFYETLFAQAGPGGRDPVFAGMGAAALLLAVLAWVILKYSVRLPIGPFFKATSALLVLMAIVFVGHGISALQEAGWLTSTPAARFMDLPWLGVYPNVQGLAAQGVVIALVVAGVLLGRRVPVTR